MPRFDVTGAIVDTAWVTDEAVAEFERGLEEAGVEQPRLTPAEYVVDLRFAVEADDEDDARDAAHRALLQAATGRAWTIIAVEPS